MSIELKQAAQQAVDAFDAFGDADDFASLFELTRKMRALRTAIQQAESEPVYWEWRHQGSHPDSVDFGQWSEWKRVEPRSALHTVEDALNEFRGYIARGHKYELRALYTHPAPGVPEFSRIAKRKLDELQEQGFAITGYAIQRGPVRGFIDGGGFVGWWQCEPDPGVPDGWRIEEKGSDIIVRKDGFGGYSARKNTESIAEAVLHELALDLLAASPAQKGGE